MEKRRGGKWGSIKGGKEDKLKNCKKIKSFLFIYFFLDSKHLVKFEMALTQGKNNLTDPEIECK